MNITGNGAGNPIDPKRPVERAQQQRVRNERPVGTESGTQAAAAHESGSPNQSSDTVDLTASTRLIEDLTEAASRMGDEPRQDLVDRISGQIASGSYNTTAITRKVAQSLLDKGLLTG
jgi:hypothetical protein